MSTAAILLTLVLATPPVAPGQPSPSKDQERAKVVAGAGSGLLISGMVIWSIGSVRERQAELASSAEEQAQQARLGRHLVLGGISLVGAGACVLGLAAVISHREGRALSLAVVPSLGGATLVLAGSWR